MKNIKYTDNSFNEIVINIFQNNTDFLLTNIILRFFGDFKIKETIPFMENILETVHGLQSFYNLTKIHSDFYIKHRSMFKKEYKIATLFLLTFNIKKSFTTQNNASLLDAVYVGDAKILEMFQSLRKNFDDTVDYRDRLFFDGLIESLSEKCRDLKKCKEKPSIKM